jgi:hypothetical protein
MAGHKLTQLGHPASKRIQTYLTDNQGLFNNQPQRRLAYADGVIAISGAAGVQLAQDLYDINVTAPELLQRFNAMLQSFGYEQSLARTADLCAEGRLWITLTGLHSRSAREGLPPRHRHGHPRHLHVWVYEIDRKNRPKEDSPCDNCKQWVRAEFLTLNGTGA